MIAGEVLWPFADLGPAFDSINNTMETTMRIGFVMRDTVKIAVGARRWMINFYVLGPARPRVPQAAEYVFIFFVNKQWMEDPPYFHKFL